MLWMVSCFTLFLRVVSIGLFACFCHQMTFYLLGGSDHSVLDTIAQLTEGRSARDQPKQPPAKKDLAFNWVFLVKSVCEILVARQTSNNISKAKGVKRETAPFSGTLVLTLSLPGTFQVGDINKSFQRFFQDGSLIFLVDWNLDCCPISRCILAAKLRT